jgi:hypothetical protein
MPGAIPRPPDIIAWVAHTPRLNQGRRGVRGMSPASVADIVRKQRDLGIVMIVMPHLVELNRK